MSAAQPALERSTPDMSPDTPSPSSQLLKPQRVLACVLCQQRKVKCKYVTSLSYAPPRPFGNGETWLWRKVLDLAPETCLPTQNTTLKQDSY